ncbi:hypothetical protein F4861DRAFT_78675 [Xylaria intraflava]|nr:hypothetical protein F4861DRAFT_78675 [Xylaria intraflava]
MKDEDMVREAPAPNRQLGAHSAVAVPSDRQAVEPSSKMHSQWNTKNLGLRIGADVTSAFCAGSVIAPFIAIIDRSIMENASGRNTLVASLKASLRTLLTRPHALVFSQPVALIFMLYGGTYLAANTLDTVTSTVRNRPATYVSSGTDKFAFSSAANIGLCIYKDSVFVRLFGPPGSVRPVQLPSYACFALRDCFTIFASFNVPPLLGPAVSARLSTEMRQHVSGQTIAQFAAPAAIQVISTPVHLLGLDLYNRPTTTSGPTLADRWALVRQNWPVSFVARVCRIVPAFGLGGTMNLKIRRNLMERLS